jgi:hypothetical protein
LRGTLVTALSRMPAEIDRLPLTDVWELFEYWATYPPAHFLLRIMAGYKPAETSASSPDADVGELAPLLGAAQKPPEYITEMVKWAEEQSLKLGIKHGQS